MKAKTIWACTLSFLFYALSGESGVGQGLSPEEVGEAKGFESGRIRDVQKKVEGDLSPKTPEASSIQVKNANHCEFGGLTSGPFMALEVFSKSKRDLMLAPQAATAGDIERIAKEATFQKFQCIDVPAASALKALTQAAGIKLFYTPSKEDKRVTLFVKDGSVWEGLQFVTKAANLKFSCKEDGIYIIPQ